MSKSKINIISIISLFIILILSIVIYFQNRIKNTFIDFSYISST